MRSDFSEFRKKGSQNQEITEIETILEETKMGKS